MIETELSVAAQHQFTCLINALALNPQTALQIMSRAHPNPALKPLYLKYAHSMMLELPERLTESSELRARIRDWQVSLKALGNVDLQYVSPKSKLRLGT